MEKITIMAKPAKPLKPPVAKLTLTAITQGALTVSTLGTHAAPGSHLDSYRIEWGDGNWQSQNVDPVSGVPPLNLTHTYDASNKYLATLHVKDRNGMSAYYSLSVTVVLPIPTPIPPPSDGAVLSLANLHYLGAMRLDQRASTLQFSFGGLAIRRVNGKTRLLVLQDFNNRHAPAEFESPVEYDAAGVVLSGTPLTPDYQSAPIAPLVTNWGKNGYDFYHGIAGKFYDANGNPANDFAWYGGGGGAVWNCFYENGKLHVMYGSLYGNYHEWGHMYCTLDDPVAPTTTAYGPFNIAKPGYSKGLRAATYFLETHDGGYGHGGAQAGSYQQGAGPDGPTLFLGFTLPGVTTPQGYPNVLTTPHKGLVYYTLNGIMNPADGSLPVGQPITAFRQPGYPYPYERSQGAHIAINPALNGGVGTWTETDQLAGMVYAEVNGKRGYIAVIAKCSNHKIGSTQTGCVAPGGQPVSHSWYAAGGNPLCDHGCTEPVQVTGPVTTHRELLFAIYDPTKIDEVKAGTRADYSVDPEHYIYPSDDLSPSIILPGVDIVGAGAAGLAIDKMNKVIYLLCTQRDDTTPGYNWPMIYVFQVRPDATS